MRLTSPAFSDGGQIPPQYTCDGTNISVPVCFEDVPEGAVSLVLVMDDPDIPDSVKKAKGIEKFDHWTVYNIAPDVSDMGEGKVSGSQGLNSNGEATYTGPCPPDGEHRYFFRLYALNDILEFPDTPTLGEVEEAARQTMIEEAVLMGRYKRKDN